VIAQGPMRILYVEDDPLVREVTCEMLAQPAHEVVAVASAEEALSVFKPDEFDLVVTDLSLPAMSGMDMGPHVRALKKPFDLPQLDDLLNELWRETGRA
jgi:CheY-like chemotaxis protein